MRRSISMLSCLAVFAVAPAFAEDRDVSELFDPAVLARNICGHDDAPAVGSGFEQLAALPQSEAPGNRPPLYTGLGDVTFKISTTKPEAQVYFDQGLRLIYGFNHGEAIRSFRAAQEIDPKCAICFWGEALALGPNINEAMIDEANRLAIVAEKRAQREKSHAAPKERALIEALAARYAPSKIDHREKLDSAYADAMKKAHEAYRDDPEIATLYAEAAMDASPRPWWQKDRVTPLGRTAAAEAVLEEVLAAHPNHPGAVHYYIHVMENGEIKRAEPSADKLASLMPNAGHMVHMPSHIFFNIGRYQDSLRTNVQAVAIDEQLVKTEPTTSDRYKFGYFPHNIDMAMGSADMSGDGATALMMADKLRASMINSTFRVELYNAVSYLPSVLFQDPATILAMPAPGVQDAFVLETWHYVRGSAYARQKDTAKARAELDEVASLYGKSKEKEMGHGWPVDVAQHMLRARIAVADGDIAEARRELEAGIAIEDREGAYHGDPPVWDVPVRHSLGVLLLMTGKADEAIPILRQSLIDMPNDGWVLYALQQASLKIGDAGAAEEYGKLFAKAWLGKQPPDLSRI